MEEELKEEYICPSCGASVSTESVLKNNPDAYDGYCLDVNCPSCGAHVCLTCEHVFD